LTARGVDVTVEVEPGPDLSTEVEQLVFRTAQEAIRNVAAHAGAEHVDIEVTRNDASLTLRVSDDGRGFDQAAVADRREQGHLGLVMLGDLAQSAGGSLRIISEPGDGTTIELEVPAR
jgi:signal transduction histidine kinase